MKIVLLYGTETGNAEMLCEDIESEFGGDHEIEVANLADTDPAALDASVFHVIVSSTYGDGELPASAQPFAAKLEAAKPDLSGLHFAIFGLGDTEYETFGQGSEQIAAMLTAQGAVQVGPRLVHDAASGDLAEDLAFAWLSERLSEAEALDLAA